MIKFKGRVYSGSHGPIVVGSPELKVRRVGYWDLVGEAEVIGKTGGRNVSIEITLHDAYTQAQLISELNSIDSKVGQNGTLEESGNVTRKLKNCTFAGYEPIPFPGRQDSSMFQDVAMTMRDDNGDRETVNGEGGWLQHVILHFRQLEA